MTATQTTTRTTATKRVSDGLTEEDRAHRGRALRADLRQLDPGSRSSSLLGAEQSGLHRRPRPGHGRALGLLPRCGQRARRIGTAVVLFPVVKRQNESVALGFVGSRVLEAAIIMTGVVSLLAVVTLRQELAGAAGTDEAALLTVGQSLVTVRDWTFVFGPIVMSGVNALLLGSLMYRSGLVPRIIPLMGLIGGPLILVSATAIVFGVWTQATVWHGIAAAPIFAWELSLGVYLIVKGFKPSPITASMVAADTPPAHQSAAG